MKISFTQSNELFILRRRTILDNFSLHVFMGILTWLDEV